jgi:D-alanyl-D-alanine carboxypeptidase
MRVHTSAGVLTSQLMGEFMKLWEDAWSGPFVPCNSFRASQSKIVAAILAVAVLTFGARLVRASVHASIVVDAQTGKVLHAQSADTLAHPASLAKLMTLYITFERLADGRLELTRSLRISRHASVQQPTRLGLRTGATISTRAAILGLVTKSANDAAVVLAEAISGNEFRFAALMTRTAHRLGMSHTSFYNASGLPDPRQWTTARDMSKLALAILRDYPTYYHFFSVRSFTFQGRTVYGHNHLLDRYAGADGLKTGYIHSSGYNLVASAVRNHRRLVGVVMGGRTAAARDRRMMTILDRGFSSRSGNLEASAQLPPPSQRKRHLKNPVAVTIQEPEPLDGADSRQWILQIGRNFSSAHSVRRILNSAIRTAPSSLRHSKRAAVKLSGHRYRARFFGLSEHTAVSTCRTLMRKGFTCRTFNNQPTREASTKPSTAASPATDDAPGAE